MTNTSTVQRPGSITHSGAGHSPSPGEALPDSTVASGLMAYATALFEGGAAALSTLLNRQIGLDPIRVEEADLSALPRTVPLPWALVEVRFVRGFSGHHWLLFKQSEAMAFGQLMLGEEFSAFSDFTSVHEDAVREAVNQMMGSAAAAVKVFCGRPVSFGQSELRRIDESPDWQRALVGVPPRQWFLEARLTIDGEPAAQVFLVVTPAVAQEITGLAPGAAPAAEGPGDVFPSLKEKEGGSPLGIDLILDITLPVTVELGRTRMLIRDILNLAPGSVLELDKLAGEPVDLLVNDKPIAKGEVVVIDENFGVRLTNIVNTTERIKNLR